MLMNKHAARSTSQALLIAMLLSTAYAQGGPRTPAASASAAPSVQTGAPAQTAAETAVTVNEQFLNAFLESMFANLKAPSVPLVITAADKERSPKESKACPNLITLQREEAGVRTAIKLEQGRITAPLAFAGSYDSTLLGCIEFRGWANTSWTLEFDRMRQALVARVLVNEIRLTNVPALAGGSLGKLVQAAIDKRINPLELLRLDQLSTRVPIAPAGGALRMRAKEVRPEIVPGAVHLHIVYEFLPDR
jgi:hypothetical protein